MPTVREVVDRDIDSVAALHRGAGWTPPRPEDWAHLWTANPSRIAAPGTARGWVLEHDRNVVGFLANIVRNYQLNRRTIVSACAASLVVDPAFRGSSLQLYLAFVRQSGVHLLLNTTAAPQVSQISQFLKFKPIPQPEYDRSAYWILRPLSFAPAALRKKGVPSLPSAAAGPFVAAALMIEGAIRRRGPRAPASDRLRVDVLGVDAIGDAFDDLWTRVQSQAPHRLLAARDAATLRWHFAARGRRVPAAIVAAFRGDSLAGYAAVVRQDAHHLGLRRARLADLVVPGDDEGVLRQLIAGACAAARQGGAAMIEAVGFPSPVRRLLAEGRPFELVDRAWPFLYRALDSSLEPALASESAWTACLYDGDGSL